MRWQVKKETAAPHTRDLGSPSPRRTLHLFRQGYGDPFPRITHSGFATETTRVLVSGNQHGGFVHVDGQMQEIFTAFLKDRAWQGFFVGFE